MLYAQGMAMHGYRESPLEQMAYRHQEGFDAGVQGYRVEAAVAKEMLELLQHFH